MSQRFRVAAASEIPPGTGKELVADGKIVAVFNVNGQFHAIDGVCRHAGGPLGKGTLTGCIVTCPWHGWQFDVTTGKHRLSSQIVQSCYPIQIDGGDLFVEMP